MSQIKEKYEPIACSVHDEYEAAVILKKILQIRWLDDAGVEHIDKILANDILVKDGQEFLIAKTRDGIELCIRLDKVSIF